MKIFPIGQIKFIIFILPVLSTIISCQPVSNSYQRGHITKHIETICKKEFNIDLTAYMVKDTIWIYWPTKNIIKNNQMTAEAEKKINNIFLGLKRIILSMKNPPLFYAFVVSNIEPPGNDIYFIGHIPDIVKAELMLISRNELIRRTVQLSVINPEAINDYTGKHIPKENITAREFIFYLVWQNLQETFRDKINFENNPMPINGYIENGIIYMNINIPLPQDNEISVFETAIKLFKEYFLIYKNDIKESIKGVEINCLAENKKRYLSYGAIMQFQNAQKGK